MKGTPFQYKLELDRQKNAEVSYTLEMQGKRLQIRCHHYRQAQKNYKSKSPIFEFSRKARAARLRRIASVNWALSGPSLFVTVTYPDEVSEHTMEERKTHRFLLNRSICQWAKKKLACFWRVEWVARKSGAFVGQLRPHMHLLYLNAPKICHLRLMKRWIEIIGVRRWTQVDVKPLEIAEAVSVYVAKYCSKEATSSYLDNVPKRNRTGRHAGELRKSLIPLHDLEVVKKVDEAIVLFLKSRACETLWWFDPRFDEGFTILGDEAMTLIKEIHERWLDRSGELD
jgi:hypothetical protein